MITEGVVEKLNIRSTRRTATIKNTKDINFSEIRSFMNKKQETINEFLFNEYKCDEWINHFNKEIF